MMYKILFILISVLIAGCSLDSESDFPNDELLKIYTENEGSPLMQPFIMVIPVEDRWIVFYNLHVYNFIYTPWKKNNNNSYFEFLKKVLIEEVKLEFTDIKTGGYSIVTKNQKIITEYNENGFDYIMNKYLIKENGSLVLNADIPDDEYYGLIKVMFYKGFCVMFDDIEGKLSFTLPNNLPHHE